MKKYQPLDVKVLRRGVEVSSLHFTTTNEIKKLSGFVGQERALEALRFGINIKNKGYNLYAMGPPGIGKYSLVNYVLSHQAKKDPTPDDWCYIYNFDMPSRPISLRLPAGLGSVLQRDMKVFIDELGSSIQSVFDSRQFRSAMRKISHYFNKKYKIDNGEKLISNIIPDFSREKYLKEKKLILKLMTAVVSPLINKLKRKYKKYFEVIKYITAVQKDILQHAHDLIHADDKTNMFLFTFENAILSKYTINLIVDNTHTKGAPVIFETMPSYSNLICRVEHASQQGNMITNFTLIRSGCMHRANGGYLILEIRKLLKHMESWEALKSTLFAQQIKIETIERNTGVKPISLDPFPIPLEIKIVLIGDRNTYYTLCQNDPDFTELFKVAVDFDEEIERNQKNIKLYAQLIGTIVKREKLRAYHANAVAAIIDYSSRLIQDIEKLSTHIRDIENLIIEANYWAGIHKARVVKENHVKLAIDAQTHRMDRARQMYYEDIYRDFIIINTQGKFVGQVNCLSVRRVGNFSYGHPTRVTARVRPGKGKLIDIQREIKMAGPMHSKAGLIIANYLASKFNRTKLFSLSASLSFEQVYCWTDGDSASVGELCALLSALADVPINQSLAVTGSIDQYGEVQAVGSLNEKIEGFYDVCFAKGLTGKQGVLIPAVNKINLMLREDIVQAAKAKKFFIYEIKSVDEAMELLTGQDVGKKNKNGNFRTHSIYHRVEKKLLSYSKNNRLLERGCHEKTKNQT